jgi:hypothetical protein
MSEPIKFKPPTTGKSCLSWIKKNVPNYSDGHIHVEYERYNKFKIFVASRSDLIIEMYEGSMLESLIPKLIEYFNDWVYDRCQYIQPSYTVYHPNYRLVPVNDRCYRVSPDNMDAFRDNMMDLYNDPASRNYLTLKIIPKTSPVQFLDYIPV